MKNNKICIIGLGYIGLPTASMLAIHGYKVTGVDINKKIIEAINLGDTHIEEPGLKTVVRAAIESGNVIAKTEPEDANVYIICVQTPLNKKTNKADLKYVKSAAKKIVLHLKKGNLIILESTVPPNTTKDVLIPILEKSGLKAGRDIYVTYCSERVLPGKILKELVENNRIIGGININSAKFAKKIYESFVKGDIYLTDITTAEFIKLMENTYRDVNIALANEFAKVSEKLGINVWEAIDLANRHPRVNIHQPGPGVGGHCISIDPWFIVEKAPEETELISLSRRINDSMPMHIVTIIENRLKNIKNPIITIFGVAYKGNVGDARESPAKKVIDLLNEKYEIKIYDPHVKQFEYELTSLEESVRDSDCIVILTDHKEFNSLDLKKLSRLMRTKKLIDTKNCLIYSDWKTHGFEVYILGDGRRR